jgi:1-acyl-sn-glycerol-3-phosphate acyltransferase/acyl carrier protein
MMKTMLANILAAFFRCLLSLRYRVRVTGLDAVRARGTRSVLFLPNHPSALEPFLMRFLLQPGFAPHVLMDRLNAERPVVRNFARLFGVIPIPDPARDGRRSKPEVDRALATCVGKMHHGENLLYYAAGRLYRSRFEDLGSNSGLERLLPQLPVGTRIILVRTRGLWGSRFSYAPTGRFPDLGAHFIAGLKALLLQGVFFAPRREVTIEFAEPADFPRTADRTVLNRCLENFYNQDVLPNLHVPLYHWEKGGVCPMPDPVRPDISAKLQAVPARVRERLLGHLAALAGRPAAEIADDTLLARGLGMDSLAVVDLGVWVEAEFGCATGDLSDWFTVGDVLLTASAPAAPSGRGEGMA